MNDKELSGDQIYSLWVDYQWGLAAPELYMEGFEDGFTGGLEWLIKKGYVKPTDKAINLKPSHQKGKHQQPPQQ